MWATLLLLFTLESGELQFKHWLVALHTLEPRVALVYDLLEAPANANAEPEYVNEVQGRVVSENGRPEKERSLKMRTMKTLATSSMLAAMPALAQDQHVVHWLEIDNKVVRPGESVVITWWCQLVPGPGEPTTYQGHAATVEYLLKFRGDMLMTTPLSGKVVGGPGFNSWAFYNNGWTQAIGNSIYTIDGQNISYSTPTKFNPVWIYAYRWQPLVYENAEATVTVDVSNAANGNNITVGVEVPALGKFFPQCMFYKWTEHTIYPAEFSIRDTPCLADCNDDEALNIDDFICFMTNFSMFTFGGGTDCDQNNKLDIDDFICFQTNFVLGC